MLLNIFILLLPFVDAFYPVGCGQCMGDGCVRYNPCRLFKPYGYFTVCAEGCNCAEECTGGVEMYTPTIICDSGVYDCAGLYI